MGHPGSGIVENVEYFVFVAFEFDEFEIAEGLPNCPAQFHVRGVTLFPQFFAYPHQRRKNKQNDNNQNSGYDQGNLPVYRYHKTIQEQNRKGFGKDLQTPLQQVAEIIRFPVQHLGKNRRVPLDVNFVGEGKVGFEKPGGEIPVRSQGKFVQ
jgi:hypothetical protein